MIQFGLNRMTENDGIGEKTETARGTARGAARGTERGTERGIERGAGDRYTRW